MINIDDGPLMMLLLVFIAFAAPFFYSFFIDKYDKKKPDEDGDGK